MRYPADRCNESPTPCRLKPILLETTSEALTTKPERENRKVITSNQAQMVALSS